MGADPRANSVLILIFDPISINANTNMSEKSSFSNSNPNKTVAKMEFN